MKRVWSILIILNLVSCGLHLPIKVEEASDRKIESTPDRLARGEYLVVLYPEN